MKNKFLILLLLLCSVSYGQKSSQSGWLIEADNIYPNEYYGVTLANGMVGMVSSPNPMKIGDVVLNGVYDNYGRGRVSNILKTFSHMNMDLELNGKLIVYKDLSNYSQVLDMRNAVLTTKYDIGNKISVKQELMSLRNLPFTALSYIEIHANEDVEIIPSNYISAPNHLSDVRNFYSEIDRPHVLIPLMTSVAYSPGKKIVAASTSFIFPEKHGFEPKIIHEDQHYNLHRMKFRKKLKAGETYKFTLVGSTISSVHSKDPQNEVERLTIFAKLEGYNRLKSAHKAGWDKLWRSDIQIEGDIEAQIAVRSALYHLYSFARKGTAYSLSPMGLSGLGYNGHVFWDTELWMFPPLLILQPDIAKSLLEYRFERLESARKNAFAHGYEGAMFPWESSEDGSEDTPVWALTGPFQQHISACVGWAFWKYFEVTKDKQWLEKRGFPVLKEVADFWVSRVELNKNGTYDINNVIGANEWEENINNNAFTNGMVKTVLEYASLASETLGYDPSPSWREVAKNIVVLKFPDGTTRENETYDGQIIKQADVNLLAYPLKVIAKKEDILKDLKYYEPKLSPKGPAMGGAILGVLYARIGNPEKSYQMFNSSYKPYELPPFGVLAENIGGTNPYFATAAGGMLQTVLFGIGGLDISSKGVIQIENTRLPSAWSSIKMTGVGHERATFEKKK